MHGLFVMNDFDTKVCLGVNATNNYKTIILF